MRVNREVFVHDELDNFETTFNKPNLLRDEMSSEDGRPGIDPQSLASEK